MALGAHTAQNTRLRIPMTTIPTEASTLRSSTGNSSAMHGISNNHNENYSTFGLSKAEILRHEPNGGGGGTTTTTNNNCSSNGNDNNDNRASRPSDSSSLFFATLQQKNGDRAPPPTSRYFYDSRYKPPQRKVFSWKLMLLLIIIIVIWAMFHRKPAENEAPQWFWDHNIYIPHQFSPDDKDNDNMTPYSSQFVIAQIASSQSLEELVDISSRPNRAYARQWNMDFVIYDSGQSSNNDARSCFDKVIVLNTMLDRQMRQDNEPPPMWPHAPRVRYDAIILLQPDSIIMDLDENLVDLLIPPDKLVAIGGWEGNSKLNSLSGILLFNLRHKYANEVAKKWWDMVQPSDVTCGANNDLGMLIDAISKAMEDGEDVDDLVQPVVESRDGFVGDHHLIKCIVPSVPESRTVTLLSHFQDSKANLQLTADSVCYRFYPKCDVL